MNVKLLIAGLLALATTLIHIIAGGEDIASLLLATPMEEEAKLVLYAVWHMASVTLGFSSLLLLKSSLTRYMHKMLLLVRFIAFLWCSFGLIFLVVIAMQTTSGWLFKLPQWLLLLPVGLLSFWGSLQSSKSLEKTW